MTPLGALLIFTIIVFIVTVLGIGALLLIKNNKAHNAIFIIVALLTMLFSFLGASSLPTNYIFEQIVSWSWGILALLSLGFQFYSSKASKYAKYLLTVAAIAAMVDLLFV